jgi:type I restriction enzyme R subunit
MSKFTEAQLESAIIERLGKEGYPHVRGELHFSPLRPPQRVLTKADLH